MSWWQALITVVVGFLGAMVVIIGLAAGMIYLARRVRVARRKKR